MQADLCRHIKTNGLQCRGVAIEGSVFCYFHNKLHRSHDVYRSKAYYQTGEVAAHRPFLELPALEDRESIQLAISTVLNALATDCITEKRAYALFNGLYLASANARGLRIVRRPTEMVRDVYKEPWVLPETNPDIAPPGRTCEIDDPSTDALELAEPPAEAVILNNANDVCHLPAEPRPPATTTQPETPNGDRTASDEPPAAIVTSTPSPTPPRPSNPTSNIEPHAPAVVGSIIRRTAWTESAGNPPSSACFRTLDSSGAM